MKFAQTIIAIALATAGAQAFAASDNKIISKDMVDRVLSRPEIVATGNITDKEYVDYVFANSGLLDAGPMPRDSESAKLYVRNKNRIDLARTNICAKFALDAINGISDSASYGSLADVPLNEDGKYQLIKTCGKAFDAASGDMANYRITKVLDRAEANYRLTKILEKAEADSNERRFIMRTLFRDVMNDAEVRYRNGKQIEGLSAQFSKLSIEGQMELAGFEKAGSYAKHCETRGKAEVCTVFKERSKPMPGVAVN